MNKLNKCFNDFKLNCLPSNISTEARKFLNKKLNYKAALEITFLPLHYSCVI